MATPEPRRGERAGNQPAAPAAADAAERDRALDPGRSFIVQAPAGSGKTELLIQRLLVLLAQVERPEQVLAITFTRKAAAEMRARLLEALAAAANEAADEAAPPPEDAHKAATRERARAVVARDRALGWALLESPARLRIQTIDSLCAALTRERPLRSGLGEAPGIAEDAGELYREAARATLAALEGEAAQAAPVERLLLHLDDNHARAEALLCTMLARRDQWLRHVQRWDDPAALRRALEAELRAAVDEALQGVHGALAAAGQRAGLALQTDLPELARHAAGHLRALQAAAQPDAPIARLAALDGLPAADADALSLWQGLADLLTTRDGGWRRSLSKNQGFPTDKAAGDPAALKAVKAQAQGFIAALADEPELAARLHSVRTLPPPAYTEAQWALLAALLALLPGAVRHLQAAFAAAGETDYGEVALAAIRALEAGEPADRTAEAAAGEPADRTAEAAAGEPAGKIAEAAPGPAAASEHRDTARGDAAQRDEARHILVDEFQDTSHSQFRLLERLTAHWPADGSHTLFLVGDPMQSIYRFREAEVGLFLRARRQGIGALRLDPLRLTVNFRSGAGLVAWVNAVFPAVLAPEEDLASGGVPFVPAQAHGQAHGQAQRGTEPGTAPGPAVWVHALPQPAHLPREALDAQEAARIAALLAVLRNGRPAERVAVLVRTRGHLRAILPALQRAGLPFQAVEIEALGERPEVQDLLMLLRALTHLGDRVAWLAVLRAPWCGLRLAELLHLAGPAPQETLWARLSDPAVTAGLPADAAGRVARVVAALRPCLDGRARRPLRRWLEGAWLALGGPACVAPGAWPNVEACLARLEALPLARQPGDPQGFAALLERLFAAPDPAADARLQVMSIHKAKGLEFDTVILPGLGRVPRHDDPPLLRWFERPLPAPGGAGLLLAPIHEAGPQRDAVYDYLAALEREKARHETGRLLYVAATRARRALHLFGHAALKDGAPVAPDGRSLLARLWPALQADFEAAAEDVQAEVDAEVHAEAPQAGAGTPVPLEPPEPPLPPAALRRLVAGWAPPAPPPAVALPAVGDEGEPPPQAYDVEFRWAGETARHVGTVVHRLLRLIARHGPERWQAALSQTERGAFSRPAIAAALAALGIPAAERDEALGRVLEALQRTLADERGRWVLAPHRDGHSEYALTGLVGGRAAHFVIDRTFVDDAGVRWIVDFKTGAHAGGELEAFLEREQQRYRAQLEGYAALLARLEPQRPIRLALYFPLLQAWREWPAPDTASPPGALPSPDA